MITEIHHVQITIPVGAEDAARAFYTGLLELTEIEKPEPLKANGGLWLTAGNLQLHLGCEDNEHRANSKAHVAFIVADLDACRRQLIKAGVNIQENTQIEGFRRFDIRDPFGNRLEIMERAGHAL